MADPYIFKDDLDYTLRYWWLLALFLLAGAAIGWGFSSLHPPQYEAQAEISINIDISRTGTLTGESQDIIIDNVGDIIGAPAVMAALREELDPPAVQQVYLERKADRFALRVVGSDPQAIDQLAERWSILAIAELDQAARHAIAAEILERYLDTLTKCVEQLPSIGTSSQICGMPSLNDVQTAIQQAGTQLMQEKDASLGMIPGVRYWLSQSAQLSEQPVQYNRKYLLLGGAMIGLALGLWLLHLRLPERIRGSRCGD